MTQETQQGLCIQTGDGKRYVSIPRLGRCPRGGHDNLLQIPAWGIPRDRGACRLQSRGSQRIGHDWSDLAHTQIMEKWKWSEVAQSCQTLCNPWTVAHKAPLSMGFSRQEYWSGLPFPSPDYGEVLLKIWISCSKPNISWSLLDVYVSTTDLLNQNVWNADVHLLWTTLIFCFWWF